MGGKGEALFVVGTLLFSAKQANAMILSYDKSTAKYLHYGEIVRCRSVGYFKLCVAGQAEGTLWWRPGKQLGSGPPCSLDILGYIWTVDTPWMLVFTYSSTL